RRGERRGDRDTGRRHLRRRQDRRVDEQDVAHREERAEATEGLRAQRRAALAEAEAPVERTRCAGGGGGDGHGPRSTSERGRNTLFATTRHGTARPRRV